MTSRQFAGHLFHVALQSLEVILQIRPQRDVNPGPARSNTEVFRGAGISEFRIHRRNPDLIVKAALLLRKRQRSDQHFRHGARRAFAVLGITRMGSHAV